MSYSIDKKDFIDSCLVDPEEQTFETMSISEVVRQLEKIEEQVSQKLSAKDKDWKDFQVLETEKHQRILYALNSIIRLITEAGASDNPMARYHALFEALHICTKTKTEITFHIEELKRYHPLPEGF